MKRSAALRAFTTLILTRRTLSVATFACCVAVLWVNAASAVVSYNGGTYTQNFDTLPNATATANTSFGNSPAGWTDDNAAPGTNFSILGWYLYHTINVNSPNPGEGGFNGRQRFRNGSGSSGTGSFYSFGTNNDTDRALGAVGASTLSDDGKDMYIALRLTNTTGGTLNSFSLTFDGEQYRNGGAGIAEKMTAGYSLTATSANFGTTDAFNPVPKLTWAAPVVGTTAATVAGNVAGKVAGLTATVSGITWADGTDLWLRWVDPQRTITDDGMGIDNVSFVANALTLPTWSGAAADNDWNNAANWTPNAVPATGNTAVFNGAGNASPITLGGTRTIGAIHYNSTAGAYTLGSSGEQFDVDDFGDITVDSGAALQTINANVNGIGTLGITNNNTAGLTLNGNLTAANGAFLTSNAGNLTVNGSVKGAITLAGTVAGTATFNGVISDPVSGTTSLVINHPGTTDITVQNTYSGGTTIGTNQAQGSILVRLSTVLTGSTITSGPFGTAPIVFSGFPGILIPVGANITIANDWGTTGAPINGGFFVASASASLDPTPRDITFTGNKYTTGSRTFTNNLVAGATLTLGSAGSPKTITRDNNLTFQSQAQVQPPTVPAPGGGVTVINDNIAASTSALLTEQTVTFQNGLKLTMNGTIGGNGNIVVQCTAAPNTKVHFNKTDMYTGTGNIDIKINNATATTGSTVYFDQPNVFGAVSGTFPTATSTVGTMTTTGLGTAVYVNSPTVLNHQWNIEGDSMVFVNAPLTFNNPNTQAFQVQQTNTRKQTAMVINSTLTRGPNAGSGVRIATGTLAGNGGTILSSVGILNSGNGASYLAPGSPALSGDTNMTPAYQNGAGLLTIGASGNPFNLDFNGTSNCAGCNMYAEIGGTTPGTQYDQVVVNGTATIGNGTTAKRAHLTVATINSFPLHPAYDATFELIKATTLSPGSGAGLGFIDVSLPDPANWHVQYGTVIANSLTVTVDGTGDFNDDHIVDAADYVWWRKNNGTPGGYDAWRRNFGNPVPGSGSGLDGAAVPEPASLLLVALGVAVLPRRRARR